MSDALYMFWLGDGREDNRWPSGALDEYGPQGIWRMVGNELHAMQTHVFWLGADA